jgi:hypothetical protein
MVAFFSLLMLPRIFALLVRRDRYADGAQPPMMRLVRAVKGVSPRTSGGTACMRPAFGGVNPEGSSAEHSDQGCQRSYSPAPGFARFRGSAGRSGLAA